MIYKKIIGVNLFSKWHSMSNDERKQIIKQLCDIIGVINDVPYKKHLNEFKLTPVKNWHDKNCSKIDTSLKVIETNELLSEQHIKKIRTIVKNDHQVLTQQKLALVYWDAHFDNILVKDNKIVGFLNFERTEIASVDYTLDVIKRMVDYPTKYMSDSTIKFAKKKDYSKLLIWFREFYPKLFNFENLDIRLDLYSIEYDLKTLIDWPKAQDVRDQIFNTNTLKKY